MRVLVTGARGFLGKNLVVHLQERAGVDVMCCSRENVGELPRLVSDADFIFHLAGVNRPRDPSEFRVGNADLTSTLCSAVEGSGRRIPVVYTSSIQVDCDNAYGESKRGGERALMELAERTGTSVHLYRLTNVFGKWSQPNYNSVIATFCHNIARGLPIKINDPEAIVSLVHVDDVMRSFISVFDGETRGTPFVDVSPKYDVTVGYVAKCLESFREGRKTLMVGRVGDGFLRALYSTYVSFLPKEEFGYSVPNHVDARGSFSEMLKTADSGQFSFFTAHPGVTRGGHYHHTKTEKFLVVRGKARFRFVDVVTGARCERETSGEAPEIVETAPGWAHDVTNIGDSEMVVLLWANEVFERAAPDTYAFSISDSGIGGGAV